MAKTHSENTPDFRGYGNLAPADAVALSFRDEIRRIKTADFTSEERRVEALADYFLWVANTQGAGTILDGYGGRGQTARRTQLGILTDECQRLDVEPGLLLAATAHCEQVFSQDNVKLPHEYRQ
jgi:hypothetical protein